MINRVEGVAIYEILRINKGFRTVKLNLNTFRSI